MNQLKDEIRILNDRIASMRYQIKQLNNYEKENIRLIKGYDEVRKEIAEINSEKKNIENNVSRVFNSFKNLIKKKGNNYLTLKASYNKDLLERIQIDNKCFEEQLSVIENKSKKLLDELYSKVKQYCSSLSSSGSDSQNNAMIDIEAIKFNLKNVQNELSFIFTEIQNILNLSSQYIEDEEEETLRNIQMIEIIVEEVERLLRFVPNDQIIRNNILVGLGINPNNYPLNTPTIRIILTNMQEVKRKRQTQLRKILDEIKVKASKILQKKSDIEIEMNKAMSQINGNDQNNINNNNNRNGKSLNLEDLFFNAHQTSEKNITDFGKNIIDKLKKDIDDYTAKIETEAKQLQDAISKIKANFLKEWFKLKKSGCEELFNHVKNQYTAYFQPFHEKYQQQYKDIVKVLRDKFLSPECEVIKQGLLHCNETIDKIKNDITPLKCIIPIGNKNNGYLEQLNELLVNNLPFIYNNNDKTLDDIYNNVEYYIKNITSNQIFEVIFPILIIHYNNFDEYEKDINIIETLIVNCLRKKVSILFFFNDAKKKELSTINKKIKEFIEKSERIQYALKESKFELSDNLGYNLNNIEGGVTFEMDKLTKFKKDIRCKIDKGALKKEYFEKMFDVYNTHPITNDLLGIKNAQDEATSRNRLITSIMDYSFISVNLYKKPKKRQLKEKEEIDLTNKVEAIINDIYDNKIMKDYEKFMNDLIERKTFDLYLERERIMADLDFNYDTSLLTEEDDGEKIKNLISQEIETIIEKKYKKNALEIIVKDLWYSFFDRFCPQFYKLLEDGFVIPNDFDQYLVDTLTTSAN